MGFFQLDLVSVVPEIKEDEDDRKSKAAKGEKRHRLIRNTRPVPEIGDSPSLEELKTLLKSQSICLSIGKADGSIGQTQSEIDHDSRIERSRSFPAKSLRSSSSLV